MRSPAHKKKPTCNPGLGTLRAARSPWAKGRVFRGFCFSFRVPWVLRVDSGTQKNFRALTEQELAPREVPPLLEAPWGVALGYRLGVLGLGFRIWGLGFRDQYGPGRRMQGLAIEGSGFGT